MPTLPEISVVIPTFNREQMVCRAVRSVLRQATMPLEVLVVDDGSTDGTRAAIAALNDNRIRYLHQANAGRSAARNRGIDAATGRFIVFLDSDDALLPEALDRLSSILDVDDTLDLVAGGWYVITDDLRQIETVSPDPATPLGLIAWVLDCPFPIHAAMLRRDRIGDARFDRDAEPSEDWAFWLELARRGARMRMIGDAVALYVFHGANSLMDYPSDTRSAAYMLDRFFALPDLPAEVRALRSRALARVHLARGLRYLDQDKDMVGHEELELAASLNPSWLAGDWPELVALCAGITGSSHGIRHDAGSLIRKVASTIGECFEGSGADAVHLARRLERAVTEQRFWKHYHHYQNSDATRDLRTLLVLDPRQALRPRVWRAAAHIALGHRRRTTLDLERLDRARQVAADCLVT